MPSPSVRRSLALAGTVLLLSSSAVYADDISNSIDASIDAVAEVMPLNAGGANGSTTLYVQPRNGDGKNGCNITGSSQSLVLSVASSNSGVATVTPTSVTFTGCGSTPSLTIIPVAAGATTISVAITSNTSDGTFNLAPATFTVNVAPPPNTAPTVDITGVAGGASYEIGAVPAAICAVEDAEDGASTFAASLSAISGPLAAYGLGERTASCTYTDDGGLEASASLTFGIVDTGNPSIAFVSRTPSPNADGWNNTDVTVEWSCSDGGSGVVDATVTQTVSSEGANQSATGTCADHAGNTATETYGGISIDKVAPTIALVSRTPAPNADGWNNTDVTVEWSCSDGGSGVVDATVTQTVSSEGANQSATGTCADHAGNTASATRDAISIDKVAPTIFDNGPTGLLGLNGWYVGEVTNTFTASDGLSGVAGPNPVSPSTGPAEGPGLTVNSGPFSDLAGNATAGIDSAAFDVDLSDPTDVAFSSNLTGSYIFGSVPPAPTCTAADAVSGLAGCVVTGYSTLVGTHTLTATATDFAGRTETATTTYTVLAWTLSGFYNPVDMGGVLNTVRGGSTVPLKFEVYAGSTELTHVGAIMSFRSAAVSCGSGLAVTDEIEVVTTGGTSLRYDATGGQFIQNWQTPKTPGVCYRVTMTTQDGSALSALFRMK